MTTKKASNAAKAVGAVMAAGSAAAMIVSAVKSSHSTKRQLRKTAGKAVKTLGDILDGIHGMM